MRIFLCAWFSDSLRYIMSCDNVNYSLRRNWVFSFKSPPPPIWFLPENVPGCLCAQSLYLLWDTAGLQARTADRKIETDSFSALKELRLEGEESRQLATAVGSSPARRRGRSQSPAQNKTWAKSERHWGGKMRKRTRVDTVWHGGGGSGGAAQQKLSCWLRKETSTTYILC